jgi:hypothetical protein
MLKHYIKYKINKKYELNVVKIDYTFHVYNFYHFNSFVLKDYND